MIYMHIYTLVTSLSPISNSQCKPSQASQQVKVHQQEKGGKMEKET
jgi:hypothetical protein